MINQEINSLIYEGDERKDLAGSRSATLSDRVIEEALGSAALRPVLKAEIVTGFGSRLRREIEGWAPEDETALIEWVKERIAIPIDEWETLCSLMPETLVENIDTAKIKTIMRNGTAIKAIVHREWEEAWKNEPLSLLGQWLRYEGPISIERISSIFGTTAAETEDAISALAEVDEVIRDVAITADALSLPSPVSSLVCDRENLDMLLRLSRKKARPVVKERSAQLLIPFLALRQGIAARSSAENQSKVLGKNLYAWTAPAKLWETEILCARNQAYNPDIIDREIREGRLVWYGSGKERIGFCRPEDLDLIGGFSLPDNSGSVIGSMLSYFDRPRDFWEIKDEIARNQKHADNRTCAQALWQEAWQGRLSADSLEPVRKGIEFGFIPKDDASQNIETQNIPFGRHPRIPRALKDRWRAGAPVSGSWFSLVMEEAAGNPLEDESLNRDRVRLLLNRWGILCRPLLEREVSVFGWSKLLPAMRRMELAGELIAGRFFSGINSLQFASPLIAAELEEAEAFSGIYWMNAVDPASPAGLEIEGLEHRPVARAGSRLYFRGSNLIAVTNKNGKDIQIFIEPDDPDVPLLIGLFKLPRTRKVLSEKNILVEKINNQTAAASAYSAAFIDCGFISDRGKLCFW